MKSFKLTQIALAMTLAGSAFAGSELNYQLAQSDLEKDNEPAISDRYEVDENSEEMADTEFDSSEEESSSWSAEDDSSSWSSDESAGDSQDHIVYFEFDSDELSDESKDKLKDLAQSQEDSAQGELVIKGFADSTGPEEYNQDLAQRRAEAVKEFLEEEGLDSQNLKVEAVGVPEGDSLADSNRENRRVEISTEPADQQEEIS